MLTKDGREIITEGAAGKREWPLRIEFMWRRDKGRCCLCFQCISLEASTFEHKTPRGGGKRNDAVAVNGVSHWRGNAAKGSMSYEKYMQKSLEERIQLCTGH